MAPFLIGCAALAPGAAGAPLEPLYGAVHREKPAAIETLQQLVGIESGSRDKEGLDRIAALPWTTSVAAPIPLVAIATSSFGAGVGSQEKTTSCSAASRVMRLRAPGVLTSSSPLMRTVSRP